MKETQVIKPPALQIGNKVGVVAPAGPIDADALEAGCNALSAMGYEPIYLPSITDRDTYFAGSAQRRLDGLHEMFALPEVRAIICARGGYGCNYLLPGLDLELIRRNPKVFVGYSDVTTLLTYITDATGMVTFHGPMVTKDFALAGGVDAVSWQKATGGGSYEKTFNAKVVQPLAKGEATGRLYGGCLSLLVASLGTPYEIRTDGTILFMEDVAARPYQVDRMLMQLKLAGKLDGIRGLICGDFRDCDPDEGSGYALQDVIMRVVGGLGVPVAYGLRSGHVCGGNITLPIGVQARIRVADEVTLGWDSSVTSE